jgi:hypothetical protein
MVGLRKWMAAGWTALAAAALAAVALDRPAGAGEKPPQVLIEARLIEASPSGGSTRAFRGNDRGTVVGEMDIPGGHIRGFSWTLEKGTKDLGTLPGGSQSTAFDVNRWGLIAGAADAEDGEFHAALWKRGEGWMDVHPTGAVSSFLLGVNDLGYAVGGAQFPGAPLQPIIYIPGTGTQTLQIQTTVIRFFSDINNAGRIVGNERDQAGNQYGIFLPAFQPTATPVRIVPPRHFESYIMGIDDTGAVFGSAYQVRGQPHPFVIVPNVNRNGRIQLNVRLLQTSVTGVVLGTDRGALKTGSAVTVQVDSGQTVVLGGLITSSRKTEIDIPILNEVPIIGTLFRSRQQKKNEKNLLMFLTPTLLQDAGALQVQGGKQPTRGALVIARSGADAQDVTAQVTVTPDEVTEDPKSGRLIQQIRVRNNGRGTLKNFALALDDLDGGRLSNFAGITLAVEPLGSPFLTPPANRRTLRRGREVTLRAEFRGPGPITYTPRVLAGGNF